MNSQRWEIIQKLFEASLELPLEDRHDFLVKESDGDQDLIDRVEALLRADESDDDTMLSTSAIGYLNDADAGDDMVLGPYRIIEILGKGGMGIVYLAERIDGQFEQRVALKVIKKGLDSESVLRRFNQERQILARLNHPNIAKLLDGGMSPDGRPYFALEYIEGRPIVKYADQHRLNVADRLKLFQAVCKAVHYAHQNLVVHRDLKPSNILVTEDGIVKLLDFGISKILNDDSDEALITKTGQMLLTPSYASPEQIKEETVTTTTDIYSLGVILYELLAGRRPFATTRSAAEIKALVLSKDPTRPSDAVSETTLINAETGNTSSPSSISSHRSTTENGLKRTLSGDLDNIVLMALRKNPIRRYQSAEVFQQDIERHLQGKTVSARKETTGYRFQKFAKRHRTGLFASVAAIFAFLTMTIFYVSSISEQRDKALAEQLKTEETVNFVTGLFYNSDPNISKGEDITAREMLLRGSDKIDDELSDQPEIQRSLRMVIGEIFLDIGMEDDAEKLLQKSLDQVMEGLDGNPSGELAEAYTLLGIAKSDLGKFDESEILFSKAQKIRRNLFGEVSFEFAESTQNLASHFQDQGEYHLADSLYKRVLEINRQLYPDGDPNLTESMTDLGAFLRLNDQDEEAEKLLREALEIQKEIYDGRHLEIASTQKSLASVLRAKKEYDEAEILYWDALATRRQLLGNNHTAVANILDSHSKLKSYIGQDDSTLIFQAESLKIMENIFGDEPNGRVAPYYNNYGMLLKDLGKLDEALEYLKKAISILELTSDPDNLNKSYPLTGIGNIYRGQGRLSESEEHLREAIRLREMHMKPGHRHLMDSKSDLGSTLMGMGRLREGESQLLEAYQVFEESRGVDDYRTQKAINRLRRLYQLKKDQENEEKFASLLKK